LFGPLASDGDIGGNGDGGGGGGGSPSSAAHPENPHGGGGAWFIGFPWSGCTPDTIWTMVLMMMQDW
jgi:hypothetical protein